MQSAQSPQRSWSTRLLVVGAAVLLAGLLVALALAGSGGTTEVSPALQSNVVLLAPLAFVAGLLSFLSPCTLPILPAYFAFSMRVQQRSVALMTVAFFLGLATTMTLLGASAGALSALLFQHLRQINLIGGLIIVGLGVLSLLGKGFSGVQFADRPAATVAGSYLYGATFAFGWTACVGPILGTLLTMLATQGIAVVQGAILAFIYALGLGMPLILVASFFSRLGSGSRIWKVLRGRGVTLTIGGWTLELHSTSVLSGVLLILTGALLASGQLSTITRLAAGSALSQWVLGLEAYFRALIGA